MQKRNHIRAGCFGIAVLLSLLGGCQSKRPVLVKHTQFLMGTLVEITLVAPDDQASADAIRGAFQEMRRVESLMSWRIEDSEVWRINQAAGKSRVEVGDDLLAVIRVALETSDLSNGRFDVTVGSLVNLWKACWKNDRVPSMEQVQTALRLVGDKDLEIDERERTIFLRRQGMALTLGGIAKGYAVDRAFRLLQSRGYKNLIVNAGGDLRTGGTKLGSPWVVGIQDPRDQANLVARIESRDAALATSGDYERYYVKDGIRYHHILDPLTGFPARGCQSVTVVAGELIRADALATAVFVLGPEKGLALIERLLGAEALIIDDKGKPFLSSGMGDRVKFSHLFHLTPKFEYVRHFNNF